MTWQQEATGFVDITKIRLTRLLPHEQTIETHVEEVRRQLESDGVLRKPIIIDAYRHIILDGHHRTEALRRMNARWITAALVDYEHPAIHVLNWRTGRPMDKTEIIRRATKGLLYPPKTTRHILPHKPTRPTPLDELL